MTETQTTWNIGGEGGNTFAFDNVGDFVQGTVLDLAEVQQTDLQSGQPAFWDDGKPKMMYRVTLQTELRDPANPADDGKRTVYLRGAKKPKDDGGKSSLCAVLDAVKTATGSGNLAYGGKLTLQYAGNGPAQRGFNPPKYYQAWYEAPQMRLEQPAEHRSTPQPPAAPQFGSPADQAGPPPAWAQPAAQAPTAGPVPSAGPPPGAQAPAAPPAHDPWATQPPAGPPAPPPAAPQIPQQAPATPPAAAAPQQPAGPTPGAPAAGQPTQEQIAGLQALGIDPATVYPGWTPQPVS